MPGIKFPSRAFAAVYDKVNAGTEAAGLAAMRRDLVSTATGATVEIGAGTGLNLDHYPAAVTRLVLTEPNAHMRARLQSKLNGRDAEVVDAAAERLGFDDDSFDTAVCTLVLCTVPEQAPALAEIRRVLKPGGRLLFLEHVLSERPGIARLQGLARPVYYVMGRGCHPNRDTLAAIRAAGFEVESQRREQAPKSPPTERELIVGVAVA
jgi:ubiquinone/menaquinone biosynthesis C-methylase UbiE